MHIITTHDHSNWRRLVLPHVLRDWGSVLNTYNEGMKVRFFGAAHTQMLFIVAKPTRIAGFGFLFLICWLN